MTNPDTYEMLTALEALVQRAQLRSAGTIESSKPDSWPLLNTDDRAQDRTGWRSHTAPVAAQAPTAVDTGTPVVDGEELLPADYTLTLERIERLDQACRQGRADKVPADVVRALRRIKKIPSGKRGSQSSRHPLPDLSPLGCQIPQFLPAKQAAHNAVALIKWLEDLRRNRSGDFVWLIGKWLFATDAQQGLIRMDSTGEAQRATSLADMALIVLQIELAPVSKGRENAQRTKRIRILVDGAKRESVKRSAGPVRWVMTWASVLYLAGGLGLPLPESDDFHDLYG